MSKFYMCIKSIDLSTIENIDELPEALAEFACKQEIIDGHHYIVCKDFKALAQMLHTLDLPGSILEVTGIYDSQEEDTTTIID